MLKNIKVSCFDCFIYMQTQLQQIKSGGYRVFIQKLLSLFDRIILIISGIWAIPILLIMRLFKGIILFRIGTIRSDRIGHFAADSGLQFADTSLKTKRTINIYWLSKYTSNKQLELMVRRNFLVFNFIRYLDYWNLLLPGGKSHIRLSTNSDTRDMMGLLQKANGNMTFLSSEESKVKEWMASYGWKDGDPFVCLQVRDSAFLEKHDIYKKSTDWKYHNYRDTDIDNYNEAIEWLASKGVWVFRMGREVHNPISIQHPKIIDYAISKTQSDLIDIWLFANCNLCISTGSGPDMVSDIYCRPLLFLNYIPIFGLFSWSNATSVPMHLKDIKTGKRLTLSDHIKHTYYHSDQYLNAGIEVEELSSIEILHAVQDRYKDIFEDKTLPNNTNDDLNDIFWDILLKSEGALERHGFINKKSRIAASFLKNNIDWLK